MTKNFIVTPENPEGVLVDKTADEITEQETRQTEHEQFKVNKANEETAKTNNRASGIAKLKADTWSPLTTDEVTALFGE